MRLFGGFFCDDGGSMTSGFSEYTRIIIKPWFALFVLTLTNALYGVIFLPLAISSQLVFSSWVNVFQSATARPKLLWDFLCASLNMRFLVLFLRITGLPRYEVKIRFPMLPRMLVKIGFNSYKANNIFLTTSLYKYFV